MNNSTDILISKHLGYLYTYHLTGASFQCQFGSKLPIFTSLRDYGTESEPCAISKAVYQPNHTHHLSPNAKEVPQAPTAGNVTNHGYYSHPQSQNQDPTDPILNGTYSSATEIYCRPLCFFSSPTARARATLRSAGRHC